MPLGARLIDRRIKAYAWNASGIHPAPPHDDLIGTNSQEIVHSQRMSILELIVKHCQSGPTGKRTGGFPINRRSGTVHGLNSDHETPPTWQTPIADFTSELIGQLPGTPESTLMIKVPHPFSRGDHKLFFRIGIPIDRVKIMGLVQEI